jgi:hypothetical protein
MTPKHFSETTTPTTTLSLSKSSDHPVIYTYNPLAPLVTSSASTFKNPGPTPFTATPIDPNHDKFFFKRFPSWVEYQDLKKAFLKFGQVTKLFVSKRKTIYGRRFSFVAS